MLEIYIVGVVLGIALTLTNNQMQMLDLERNIQKTRNYNGLHRRKKEIWEETALYAVTSLIWPIFVIWLFLMFITQDK